MAEPLDQDQLEPRRLDRLVREVLVLALVWNLVGNLALPDRWYVPANLTVTVLVLGLARRRGLDWPTMGLQRSGVLRGLGVGLAAAFVVGLGLALLVWGFENAFRSDDVLEDSTFEHWFVPLVRIPLGTALFEEVLFRSVLLGALLACVRTRRAVVASSVLFGLWHVVPALETADGTGLQVATAVAGTLLVTTAGGVLFALLRLWSSSVIAPILAHWSTNSLSYLAALVALDLV